MIAQFQVNISLAILFATEGFFPKDADGSTIATYKDFNSALPLITFIISLFASSFGKNPSVANNIASEILT